MPPELYGKLKVTFDEAGLVQELDEFPLVEGLVLYRKGFHKRLDLANGGPEHLSDLGIGAVPILDLLLVGGPVSYEQGSVPEILLLGFRLLREGLRHGAVELLVLEISLTNSLSFKLLGLV